jgi:hypothetical protein
MALETIKKTWMEILCFPKFDIKKCYGTIDRQRLVFIFLEEIHDRLLI